jgi:hypothetical protein
VFKAFYDAGRKCYWVENARGGWIEVNEASLSKRLRRAGLRLKAAEGEYLSEVHAKLIEIQDHYDLAYAGPLAGHQSGLVEISGNRILVTSSPKLIEPQKGEWKMLSGIIDNLLIDGVYDQRDYVFGWSKVSYEALRAGVLRPGQAMVLAGPKNCGKSLLQALFTEILGGRCAKPYRYMSGSTPFNADLFGAEHLMIEDEHSSTDIRARRALGSHIKQLTVNQMQSCHDKGRRAITLNPFWRVSISVNDEPEAMMVLPPMSDAEQDSLSDKLFLLRARKAQMPMATDDYVQRTLFWQRLMGELPAFLYFLVNWQIPETLRDGRFGIKTWHHPKLLADLDALAPETRLLALIDEVVFGDSIGAYIKVVNNREVWQGTAEQLEQVLFGSDFKVEAQRLLTFSIATGTYLGRLASKRPDRVKKNRSGDSRGWMISRPASVPDAAAA